MLNSLSLIAKDAEVYVSVYKRAGTVGFYVKQSRPGGRDLVLKRLAAELILLKNKVAGCVQRNAARCDRKPPRSCNGWLDEKVSRVSGNQRPRIIRMDVET